MISWGMDWRMFTFNGIAYWILIMFQSSFLEKRKNFISAALVGWVVFELTLGLAAEHDNTYINRINGLIFLFAASFFCYKERLLKIFALTSIYRAILNIVQGTVMIALNTYLPSWNWDKIPYFRNVMAYIFIYSISFVIVLLLKVFYKGKITVNSTAALAALSCYSILLILSLSELLYTVFSYDYPVEYILSFFFLIAPLFSYIFMFLHFDSVSKRKELEMTAAVSREREQNRDLLFQQYEKNMYEKNAIIHDYKNNLLHLAGISGNAELVQSYCNELAAGYSKQLEHYNFDVGNEVLSTILGKLKYDCEQYDIELDLQILHGDFSFIGPIDASSLFGNLFDNAAEACRIRGDNRRIEAALSSKNGFAYVKAVNTYGNMVSAEQGAFLSAKRKYASKGHGMDIIKSVAAKYQGDMNVSFDDTSFTVTVWLNMAAEV